MQRKNKKQPNKKIVKSNKAKTYKTCTYLYQKKKNY